MNSASIDCDWVGRVIDGRFSLLQWLGGSERGAVFLTELEGDAPRKAAIKLIPADGREAEALLAGWAATATLSHPHLLPQLHFGRYQGGDTPLLYAVTEYAEEDLSQVLPERPLTPSETREMLEPLLQVLGYLHENGFVHGRLKPSNILVVNDQLKISWECLRIAGEPAGIVRLPRACDAPESAAGPLSPAADIWSLGVLLVEALTQHPPLWERSTDPEPMVPESVPEPFANLARECLRSDPARRCNLREIKTRLESFRTQPASVRSLSAPEGKTGKTTSLSAKLFAAALVAAVLVLFAVWATVERRSPRSRPSLPTEEERTEPASVAPPASSPAPAPLPMTQSSQSSAVKGEVPMKGEAAVKGEVAEQVMPDVPQKARDTIQGTLKVTIRVTVDSSGAVSDATIDSTGSKYFANLAQQAARRWRFRPVQVDQRSVSRVWLLQFQFTQTATNVTPAEVSP